MPKHSERQVGSILKMVLDEIAKSMNLSEAQHRQRVEAGKHSHHVRGPNAGRQHPSHAVRNTAKMEGPFTSAKSGKSYYYDPGAERYYDHESDMHWPVDYHPDDEPNVMVAKQKAKGLGRPE